MVLFRDRLRAHDQDRELYESTKRDLVAAHWSYVLERRRRQVGGGRGIFARADEDRR
jgi:GrpB-like predicted nucleotidyltransferase (UPF0157 family)